MEYLPVPNLLLEALTYLGARANGHTPEDRAARLRSRGLEDFGVYSRRSAPFSRLMKELDDAVDLPGDRLDRLFRDMEGFPYNTIGSYSPAFLLFYPELGEYDGDFAAVLERLLAMSPDQIAANLLLSLSMDDLIGDGAGCTGRFMDAILSLSIPAESRLALLGILRSYPELLREAADCLRPVLAALEVRRDLLDAMALALGQEMDRAGPEEFLQATSSLAPQEGAAYRLRPYVLGPDTNLSLTAGDGTEIIYCGIHRRLLKELLESVQDSRDRVFAAIKLLGDRTRFDILCYLRDHPAYGQELSDRFGLARNTIHHHMSKLLNAGLVTCTMEGNRVYYATDSARLGAFLQLQRSLLLGPEE